MFYVTGMFDDILSREYSGKLNKRILHVAIQKVGTHRISMNA